MVPRLPDSWSNWNLEMLVFEERKQGREEQKLNPRMAPTPGFEPRSHWWEASALTTAASLAPTILNPTRGILLEPHKGKMLEILDKNVFHAAALHLLYGMNCLYNYAIYNL